MPIEDEAHSQRARLHAMRMSKYEPYKMGLSPETAAAIVESAAFDEIAAYYISKGLSPAVAEAEAEADIRYYKHTQHDNIQDELYGMGLSPETVAAFAELIADNHNDVNDSSIFSTM